MKIVNLDEFLLLPDGIVFLRYNLSHEDGFSYSAFEDLEIKTGTILHDSATGDFFSKPITHELVGQDHDTLEKMTRDSSMNVYVDFYDSGRDGGFDEHQLFAVYEKGDVRGLIKILTESLKSAYN